MLFLICFLTGIGILIFNLIFGSLSDFFSIDFDLDFDTDFQGGHHGHGLFGFMSPSVLSGFLIAFGGMGLFFRYMKIQPLIVLSLASLSGALVGWAFWKLMRLLKRHENGGAAEVEDLLNLPAKVLNAILEGGYGSIKYIYEGNTFTSPAVSYEGTAIPQGADVTIVAIKNHLYYVSEIKLEE